MTNEQARMTVARLVPAIDTMVEAVAKRHRIGAHEVAVVMRELPAGQFSFQVAPADNPTHLADIVRTLRRDHPEYADKMLEAYRHAPAPINAPGGLA